MSNDSFYQQKGIKERKAMKSTLYDWQANLDISKVLNPKT